MTAVGAVYRACALISTPMLLAMASTGCSASGSHAPAASSVPSPTGASTAGTVDDAASRGAVAAYTGMWSEYANAAHTGEWMDSALTHDATESALADLVKALHDEHQEGLVSEGAPVLHPKVIGSTATSVDISDCASSANWLEYVKATGKLEDNVPGGNRLITGHVEYAGGLWRVTRYSVGEVGSC